MSAGFTKNRGQIFNTDNEQTDEPLYYAPSGNMAYFLLADKISYVFQHTDTAGMPDSLYRMDMLFENSNPSPSIIEDYQVYYKNYYTSNLGSGIEDVGVFNEIIYQNIVNDIDLSCNVLNSLQLSFTIAPGVSPANLKLYFAGNDSVAVDSLYNAAGIFTPAGIVQFDSIYAYQIIGGIKNIVTAQINLDTNNRLIFIPGSYNTNYALTIVLGSKPYPTCCFSTGLFWSTFLQSSSVNYTMDVSIGAGNNVYCTGACSSDPNFPIQFGQIFQYQGGIYDAFVFRFDRYRKILWGSYFGGSDSEQGLQVASNLTGDVYICGDTYSSAISAMCACTPDPLLNNINYTDGRELFIAKFDAQGHLGANWPGTFATYYGPTAISSSNFATVGGMAIDANDNVYIGGRVNSIAYPTFPFVPEPGAFNQPFKIQYDGAEDAFIIKLSSTNTVVWSTALSGAGFEGISGMSAADNRLFVTGYTTSDGQAVCATPPCSGTNNTPAFFPLANATGSYYKSANSGGSIGTDAFVMVFNMHDAIEWATLFGGTGDDNENTFVDINSGGIVLSDERNVFITGSTKSTVYGAPGTANFPQVIFNTPLAYNQAAFGGNEDAFLAMFSPTYGLRWSTFWGGASQDRGTEAAAAPSSGYSFVYFTGNTYSNASSLMKVNSTGYSYNQATNNGGGDAYILQFYGDATYYVYGTWFGSSGHEESYSLAARENHFLFCGESFYAPTGIPFPFRDPTPLLLPGNVKKAYFYGTPQSPASYDAFITNMTTGCNPCSRVAQNKNNPNNVVVESSEVFPNPADEFVELHFADPANLKGIRLYNSIGKEIKSLNPNENILYTDQWSPGIYLIRLEYLTGQQKTIRFIIK